MKKKICPNCEKEVDEISISIFRSLIACKDCIDAAVKNEKEFRGRVEDELRLEEIDFQRELSEGCLDEYSY